MNDKYYAVYVSHADLCFNNVYPLDNVRNRIALKNCTENDFPLTSKCSTIV